jgi:hypothetical protein
VLHLQSNGEVAKPMFAYEPRDGAAPFVRGTDRKEHEEQLRA